MRAGDPDDKACRERINRLRLGLHSSEFRQVYIGRFIETWSVEAPVLRGQRDEYENLVALWTEEILNTGSRVWGCRLHASRSVTISG